MGKIIKLEGGTSVELVGDAKTKVKAGGSLLGKGGQGAVYLVNDAKRQKKAFKRYLVPMSRAFIDNLRTNIEKGAPSDHFLWPQGLSEPLGPNRDLRGYIMEVYDSKKYSSFKKLLMSQVYFSNKETQLGALIELVDAFEALHARGFSYQDLNDGGVLFDCQNGKVLVCDCDNVAPSGENIPVDDEGHCIQGKFKFMAPEVAINMFKPDKHSDRFSLAVLLFMLLTHAHPYDGIKRFSGPLDQALKEKVYGTEPVFIFHPTNTTNRPDPVEDKNAIVSWPTIPKFIQDLFIKTFTSGMPRIGETREELERDRQGRTSEKEWREALQRWMDTMCSCPSCNLSVCPTVTDHSIQPMQCPHCKKKIQIKLPVLLVKKRDKVVRTLILDDGKVVPKSSVTKERSHEPAIEVIRSTKNREAYAMKNLLPYQWKCVQTGSKDRLVKTGEIVGAFDKVFIEFDYDFSGEIHYTR